MKFSTGLFAGLGCLLAGCAVTPDPTDDDGFIVDLPPAVQDIADPRQNLTAVKIDPADGCYVYQYAGPVETTLLPLRTTQGRPICGPAPAEPTPEA